MVPTGLSEGAPATPSCNKGSGSGEADAAFLAPHRACWLSLRAELPRPSTAELPRPRAASLATSGRATISPRRGPTSATPRSATPPLPPPPPSLLRPPTPPTLPRRHHRSGSLGALPGAARTDKHALTPLHPHWATSRLSLPSSPAWSPNRLPAAQASHTHSCTPPAARPPLPIPSPTATPFHSPSHAPSPWFSSSSGPDPLPPNPASLCGASGPPCGLGTWESTYSAVESNEVSSRGGAAEGDEQQEGEVEELQQQQQGRWQHQRSQSWGGEQRGWGGFRCGMWGAGAGDEHPGEDCAAGELPWVVMSGQGSCAARGAKIEGHCFTFGSGMFGFSPLSLSGSAKQGVVVRSPSLPSSFLQAAADAVKAKLAAAGQLPELKARSDVVSREASGGEACVSMEGNREGESRYGGGRKQAAGEGVEVQTGSCSGKNASHIQQNGGSIVSTDLTHSAGHGPHCSSSFSLGPAHLVKSEQAAGTRFQPYSPLPHQEGDVNPLSSHSPSNALDSSLAQAISPTPSKPPSIPSILQPENLVLWGQYN
ncbi:hypothetical protein CLOM_g19882 [Closterium sp. NIES-68]|nr:hypothetical protein CLOM_g19882 [Closterium sp. NIES-68]GJP60931.1 hypothetical protein CLOP_g18148 [Closterium sp. NIES-67]